MESGRCNAPSSIHHRAFAEEEKAAAIAAAQASVASSETLIWEREGAATCHSPNGN